MCVAKRVCHQDLHARVVHFGGLALTSLSNACFRHALFVRHSKPTKSCDFSAEEADKVGPCQSVGHKRSKLDAG